MSERVIVATAAGKRDMADWLAEHDPETLAAMSQIAAVFGRFQQVELQHEQGDSLREFMRQRRENRQREV